MTIQEFGSALFEIEVIGHIYHLQTKSFAAHAALDSLYKDIVDLRDKFIEDYQGKYGIIINYTPIVIRKDISIIDYLKVRMNQFEAFRLTIKEGYLQQDIDDIQSLLSSTLYKLENLS